METRNTGVNIVNKVLQDFLGLLNIDSNPLMNVLLVNAKKKFPSQWNLDRHIRAHNGVKPFSCSECKRYFADKASLGKHMLAQHQKVLNNKTDHRKIPLAQVKLPRTPQPGLQQLPSLEVVIPRNQSTPPPRQQNVGHNLNFRGQQPLNTFSSFSVDSVNLLNNEFHNLLLKNQESMLPHSRFTFGSSLSSSRVASAQSAFNSLNLRDSSVFPKVQSQ